MNFLIIAYCGGGAKTNRKKTSTPLSYEKRKNNNKLKIDNSSKGHKLFFCRQTFYCQLIKLL